MGTGGNEDEDEDDDEGDDEGTRGTPGVLTFDLDQASVLEELLRSFQAPVTLGDYDTDEILQVAEVLYEKGILTIVS
eukprot:1044208-Prorocentrum_minimum.AAC.2